MVGQSNRAVGAEDSKERGGGTGMVYHMAIVQLCSNMTKAHLARWLCSVDLRVH